MSARPALFFNARLVDPGRETETRGGVLTNGASIVGFGADARPENAPEGALQIDCGGDILCPGLVDMRACVGEPGGEHRETIETASAAAAAGGVTTLVATPGPHAAVDDPIVVAYLKRRAEAACVRVLPAAAITKGLRGEEIAEIGLLQEAGAALFTDGARSVRSAQVMRRALLYARGFDALVAPFTQDDDLAGAGAMNAGLPATRLGLGGVPVEAEAITLERDMRLVAMTGARYHAALVSTRPSLEIIARAKDAGLPVTCGVSIQHLTFNDNDVGDYRTEFKVSPPLRGEDERLALVEAVRSGLIDVIVSDHDPQTIEAKCLPFEDAASGAVALETMLAASLRLVHSEHVSMTRLIKAMSLAPASVMRLPQGRLAIGAPADLVRFDPDEPFVLDPLTLRSRAKNTPFAGARLQGRVKTTMVAGALVGG